MIAMRAPQPMPCTECVCHRLPLPCFLLSLPRIALLQCFVLWCVGWKRRGRRWGEADGEGAGEIKGVPLCVCVCVCVCIRYYFSLHSPLTIYSLPSLSLSIFLYLSLSLSVQPYVSSPNVDASVRGHDRPCHPPSRSS